MWVSCEVAALLLLFETQDQSSKSTVSTKSKKSTKYTKSTMKTFHHINALGGERALMLTTQPMLYRLNYRTLTFLEKWPILRFWNWYFKGNRRNHDVLLSKRSWSFMTYYRPLLLTIIVWYRPKIQICILFRQNTLKINKLLMVKISTTPVRFRQCLHFALPN